jgi:hypothetical protein
LPNVLVHDGEEMASLDLAQPRGSKVRVAEEVHPRKARRREGLAHVVGHDVHPVPPKLHVVGPKATVRAVRVSAKRGQGRHGGVEFRREVRGVVVPHHGVDVRQLLRALSPGGPDPKTRPKKKDKRKQGVKKQRVVARMIFWPLEKNDEKKSRPTGRPI